jgi:hypothetical protein
LIPAVAGRFRIRAASPALYAVCLETQARNQSDDRRISKQRNNRVTKRDAREKMSKSWSH